MRAIVFGGSGFLGSHVADELSNRGYEVIIFDQEYSQYIRHDQKMVLGDILDAKTVLSVVDGCDFVYNFAGLADLDDAIARPLDTVQLNIVGNLHIIEAAIKASVKRYIYASSIYVYSQKGGFYRCSKQASEAYIEEYQRRYGLSFTILRYGTVYGPRADDRNSIYRYLKQAMESRKIVCNGNGNEMREYINIRDAARLSIEILNDEFVNKHVIITGNYPMRFKDMIMMIREMLGGDVEVQFTGEENIHHYDYTPYSYVPKVGQKLVSHYYLDMGQGLLECLSEMYQNGK
jgi:UDP-glucose 4-epimerase